MRPILPFLPQNRRQPGLIGVEETEGLNERILRSFHPRSIGKSGVGRWKITLLFIVACKIALGLTSSLELTVLSAAEKKVTISVEENKITILKEKFEEAHTRVFQPITDLNRKYLDALNRLLDAESSIGHLENSLFVKKEIEAFGDGSSYETIAFQKRATKISALERIREKYEVQRNTIDARLASAKRDLLRKYSDSLEALEKEFTQQQKFELALAAKAERERVLGNTSPQSAGNGMLNGKLHFIVKGEIEIRHNGERLRFRDESDASNYIVGESSHAIFNDGDILEFKLKSNNGFRSVVACLLSDDAKVGIPITMANYVILKAPLNWEVESGVTSNDVKGLAPAPGPLDINLPNLWKELRIPRDLKSSCEWAMIEDATDWNYYAIVIRESNLKPLD